VEESQTENRCTGRKLAKHSVVIVLTVELRRRRPISACWALEVAAQDKTAFFLSHRSVFHGSLYYLQPSLTFLGELIVFVAQPLLSAWAIAWRPCRLHGLGVTVLETL
jgi:hypothetical protein